MKESLGEKAESKGWLKNLLSKFGPGLIVAATVLGPGSLTVSSKSGALMGYSILWTVVISAIFMTTFTRMAARIGCSQKRSLLELVTDEYGKIWAILTGIMVFLICGGFQTGNNIGVGLSLQAMFGGSIGVWAILFLLIALVIIWISKDFYQILEKIMLVLVIIMVVSFFVNVFMSKPSISGIASGLIPSKPPIWGLVIAISATSFSVAGAAYQSYMVQGKGWGKNDIAKAKRDSTFGIIILCGLSALIMITSAAVLAPKDIKVNSAVDMAIQLEPLLGSFAKWIFLFGLLAASFSSFISNAVLGGMMLSDGLGLGRDINSKMVKIFSTILLVFSTLLAVILQQNPIQVLVVAQASTILGGPLVAIILILLGNNEKVLPQEQRNSIVSNIIAVIAVCWIFYLSYTQLIAFIK
jgi:Mn2+/Fe2+ NRAMP family transporter